MTTSFHNEAVALLDLLESDFGQSGRDVRLEAIRCELEKIYSRGAKDRCDECKGVGSVCVGYSGRDDDGNAPLIETCESCGGNGFIS